MKANELMIGDWVNYLILNISAKVEDIMSTGRLGIRFTDSNGKAGYIHGIIKELVKPIPLTAEILEKNGFWSQHNVGYVMEEHENEIIYDLLDYKLRILKNREQILNLESFGDMCVHELQHALRLVGVEKKIEL